MADMIVREWSLPMAVPPRGKHPKCVISWLNDSTPGHEFLDECRRIAGVQ